MAACTARISETRSSRSSTPLSSRNSRLAREHGLTAPRLETGQIFAEAIGLYSPSGYASVPRFGAYANNAESVCFEKIR
ncbi:hypothetical protein Misp02_21860 [Microtetraspora sp. NBRC 16547]|nr:hypothetical protein Misp02_21860 [Microtetraspora sp. NBRC 16547]